MKFTNAAIFTEQYLKTKNGTLVMFVGKKEWEDIKIISAWQGLAAAAHFSISIVYALLWRSLSLLTTFSQAVLKSLATQLIYNITLYT